MNESDPCDAALAELLTLTVEVDEYATCYRNHLGQLHRIHGPAEIWRDGSKHWYIMGKRHRDDGPAVILSSGSTMWFQNGKRHRADGPAVIYPTGGQFWYLNDEQLTEGYFNERAKSI